MVGAQRFLPCVDHEPYVLPDGKVLATCRCNPVVQPTGPSSGVRTNPQPLLERHNVADEVECSKRWGSHSGPVIFPGHRVCVLPPDTGAGLDFGGVA